MSTTLDQAWEQFAGAVLPEDAPPEAQAVYRMIFCAGVHAVASLTMELKDKTDVQGATAMRQFFTDAQNYGHQWVANAHLAETQNTH